MAFGLSSLLVALAGTPAQAQLGRLKKMAGDAAKKKAGVEQPIDKKTTETAVANESSAISSDRIDAVVAALEPLVASAEKQAAANAVRTQYEADAKQSQACVEAFATSGVMPSSTMAEEYGKSAQQLQVLSERAEKAMAAGQFRTGLATRDSAMVSQILGTAKLLSAKCKPYPYKPAAMITAEAQLLLDASEGRMKSGDSGDGSNGGTFEVPAASRGGMSTRMFGRTRERMALYGMLEARLITTNQAGAEGVFTNDERAALDGRKAQILRMAPLFHGRTLQWQTWPDLKAW